MHRPIFRQIAIAFLLFSCTANCAAQESAEIAASSSATSTAAVPKPSPRKKIGLALAGGSAHGLAHIGVLRWFEENHIPVDYLAGTSMGALIGGMYATGHDSAYIKDFAAHTDWGHAFGPAPSYPNLSFRRKEDQKDFSNELEFGWKHGFHTPEGLNSGQAVSLILSRFAAPYSEMKSFDDLPTPFRCVATDLVESEQVVFANGSLADALRSTMSLPAIFAPVHIGKRVLVDGGILNNLPTDVVKDMGAEIVIAVELRTPKPKPTDVDSFLGVARQSIAVSITANERHNFDRANVQLSPDLNGLDSFDFKKDKLNDFIQRGYDAAASHAAELKNLALTDAEWADYIQTRQQKMRSLNSPAEVTIAGAERHDGELAKKLSTFAGKPVDTPKLENTLEQITGLGPYSTATYEQVQRGGKDALAVQVNSKHPGPPFLNLGFAIDGARIDDVRFDFGGRITFADLGLKDSEWRIDFNLGNRNLVRSEYQWRIMGSPLFLAHRAFFETENQDLYANDKRTAEYSVQTGGTGVDFGIAGGRHSEFRMGWEYSHRTASVDTGLPLLPSYSGDVNLVRSKFTFDNTDSPTIPTRGFRTTTELQGIWGAPLVNVPFTALNASIQGAFQVTPKYLLISQFSGGTTFKQNTPYGWFTLGGPQRLGALGRNQLRGDNYYLGKFDLLRSIKQDPIGILNRIYIAAGYEVGGAFMNGGNAKPFNDGTVGFVAVSRLGVLYLGGAVGEAGHRRIFFRLGKVF